MEIGRLLQKKRFSGKGKGEGEVNRGAYDQNTLYIIEVVKIFT